MAITERTSQLNVPIIFNRIYMCMFNPKNRGGSRISGKGARRDKGMGFALLILSLFFLNIP